MSVVEIIQNTRESFPVYLAYTHTREKSKYVLEKVQILS
jgi:hypothetical protein